MKKFVVAALLISSICMLACKKDPVNQNVVTATKLTGKWKYEKYGDERPIGAAESFTNYTNYYFDFKSDHNLAITDGNNAYSDTWHVLNDGTMLHFDGDMEIYYIISKLDDHNLVYYNIFQDNGGYGKRNHYFSK
ncbi:MAG: hypothetical protein ACKOWL_02665 [Sphingobacteriaceae bacterium]